MKIVHQRATRPALALFALVAPSLSLALDYSPARTYTENCVVAYENEVFRAKWWVETGHTPAEVDSAPNPWDTPWERVAQGSPTGCPGEDPVDPGNPDPGTPGKVLLSTLLADEARMTSDPLMTAVRASVRTLDNASVEAVAPHRAGNPGNVRRVEAIVDEARFDYLFPLRAPEYTYRGFLQAVAKFPAICDDYTDGRDAEAICRKTLATMFAHFAQETGAHESWRPIEEYRQALAYVREMGWSEGAHDGYNGECKVEGWIAETWPCGKYPDGAFKSYFGRGAKQLSYNFNYGPFSEAMYGDVRPLLDAPERVADTWLNLASATFFFTYPQPPKPSMLHVIDGTWQPNDADRAAGLVPGFGVTTQIINGGVECGGSAEHAQSANRITYYRAFAATLGVPVPADEVLGCKGMKQFAEGGAGALPIYWENNWTEQAGCKLVGYQTPFSGLKTGDYVACVRKAFPDVEIVDDTRD
ncbi:MAG TPA: glycoside hydrolase family 19 protein [Luteibacter sp.]|uniref:glycoside hydrolase family 19 protein n=1 Tax=Luteibacter sp. TaxID=1886636 RepID=UPI002B524EC4|nr:glycoside hydrolase family 19 protein [Luteibacter sp.]HVI54037.1 glycoside hydrolase family 19 protein [Luteibacter sp.]